jgi:hypothetical protein
MLRNFWSEHYIVYVILSIISIVLKFLDIKKQ